jgi:hypothetical protein
MGWLEREHAIALEILEQAQTTERASNYSRDDTMDRHLAEGYLNGITNALNEASGMTYNNNEGNN